VSEKLLVWVLVLVLPAACVRVGYEEGSGSYFNKDLDGAADGGTTPDHTLVPDQATLPDRAPVLDGAPPPDGARANDTLAPDADVLAIISSPVKLVGKLSTYHYDPEANRPDPLKWSLADKPAGMIIDPATGLVTWDHGGTSGTYPVTIVVEKNGETAQQSYTVVVISGVSNGLTPTKLRAGLAGLPDLARAPLAKGPRGSELRRYIVSCARRFAPAWREGPCGVVCQEWVSACLLARLNTRGQRLPLLLMVPDRRAEAGFFGNLFVDPPRLFSCSGGRVARAPGRECASPRNACGVTWIGRCAGRRERVVTVQSRR
jgi:hypothetical protein